VQHTYTMYINVPSIIQFGFQYGGMRGKFWTHCIGEVFLFEISKWPRPVGRYFFHCRIYI